MDREENTVIFDENYWNTRWKQNETGWDIGYASHVLTDYMSTITDKNCAILIPGCGNAYEATYLLDKGFTNITLIDIAQLAASKLKVQFNNNKNITVLCEDFFKHNGSYDIILEQTFLSALKPDLRTLYVKKMSNLLKEKGKLVGVLFNKDFKSNVPPFGGTILDYKKLFTPYFTIKKLEEAYNSIPPRAGNEVFIELIKK